MTLFSIASSNSSTPLFSCTNFPPLSLYIVRLRGASHVSILVLLEEQVPRIVEWLHVGLAHVDQMLPVSRPAPDCRPVLVQQPVDLDLQAVGARELRDQLLRVLGQRRNNVGHVVDQVPERLKVAKDTGCIPIDFTKGDPVQQIIEANGDMVDRAVDAVGYQAVDKGGKKEGPKLSYIKQLLSSRMLIGVYIGQYCITTITYFFLTWFPVYLVQARGMSILKAGFGGVCGWYQIRRYKHGQWPPELTMKAGGVWPQGQNPEFPQHQLVLPELRLQISDGAGRDTCALHTEQDSRAVSLERGGRHIKAWIGLFISGRAP